ncbi:MAG: FkbM family methyltransferase [Flavobacteriales bacterium]|nr:FkbM family methyltransferase [Flavobacteriales bacterium]
MRRYATYCPEWKWDLLHALDRLGVLQHLSFRVHAHIMGRRVRVPLRAGVGKAFLMVGEPWAHHLFPPLFKAFPGLFLDVGVNLGQTMTLVRLIDPHQPYLGFEPNPISLGYALQLASLNGFQEVPVMPFGLSDRDADLDLQVDPADPTDPAATVVADFRPGGRALNRVPVRVLTFSSAEKQRPIGRLGVVKIDVEGSEREVLRGLDERLGQDRPALVLEVLPTGIPPFGDRLPRQQDIEAQLARLDYRILRIDNKPNAIALERLKGPIGIHADQEMANLIAVPAERAEEIFAALEKAVA